MFVFDDLKIRLCPQENPLSHSNRFHPDQLCPKEGCKRKLELYQPQTTGESVCMELVHPEQLQSGLCETELY